MQSLIKKMALLWNQDRTQQSKTPSSIVEAPLRREADPLVGSEIKRTTLIEKLVISSRAYRAMLNQVFRKKVEMRAVIVAQVQEIIMIIMVACKIKNGHLYNLCMNFPT